jgi:hypothetical protein
MQPMTEEAKNAWRGLADLLGFPPPVSKLWKLLADIISPDADRARVLIVASMIDKALEEMLRWKFMQTAGVTKKDCNFFLSNPPISPLGSFAVRARMAFVLGLISRKNSQGPFDNQGLQESLRSRGSVANDYTRKGRSVTRRRDGRPYPRVGRQADGNAADNGP